MFDIRDFLSKKGIGFYLTAAAIVFTLLALIFVAVTGSDKGDLSAGMIVLFILAMLFLASALIKDFYGAGLLGGCVCAAAGLMMLVVGRLNMLGLIFNGVVEEEIPAAFIAAVVFTLLAILCNCVSGFLGVEKKAEA